MVDRRELQGKYALVTGVGGDIGVATASCLARRGAAVVGIDINEEALQRFRDETGENAIGAFMADVTDDRSFSEAIASAYEAMQRIDIFFNNAGIAGPHHLIPSYPLESFRAVLETNVIGVFLGLKHVIPLMVSSGGGSIINSSSAAGLRGAPGLSAYVASKHAVIGLTRSAAAEWAAHGVRINCIAPGPISGRMMHSIATGVRPNQTEELEAEMAARIPSKRFGKASEVAALVAFLASDDAVHINGSVQSIDGGVTAA